MCGLQTIVFPSWISGLYRSSQSAPDPSNPSRDSASVSRSTFAVRFSSCFGRTPMAFLRDVRLRKAAALLHDGNLPVVTIATRVGFSSRSHFTRAFEERFGVSPSGFRRGRSTEIEPSGRVGEARMYGRRVRSLCAG